MQDKLKVKITFTGVIPFLNYYGPIKSVMMERSQVEYIRTNIGAKYIEVLHDPKATAPVEPVVEEVVEEIVPVVEETPVVVEEEPVAVEEVVVEAEPVVEEVKEEAAEEEIAIPVPAPKRRGGRKPAAKPVAVEEE